MVVPDSKCFKICYSVHVFFKWSLLYETTTLKKKNILIWRMWHRWLTLPRWSMLLVPQCFSFFSLSFFVTTQAFVYFLLASWQSLFLHFPCQVSSQGQGFSSLPFPFRKLSVHCRAFLTVSTEWDFTVGVSLFSFIFIENKARQLGIFCYIK